MNQLKLNNEMKNFYLLQIGQFVSQFGSKMTSYGLILWAFGKSGSVFSTSLLTICTVLPSVLLSFIAGSLTDKWNKKRIMVFSDTIAAFFSLITLVLVFNNALRIEYLYFINVVLGIVMAFQDPAASVVISLIVSKENYMKTSGIRAFAQSFTTIFVPVVSTFFYEFMGLKLIIIVDLCTFVFAMATLWFFVMIPEMIPDTKVKEGSVIQNCKIGMQFLIRKKEVFHLVLFMGFVNLIAAMYNCNLAPMVLSRTGYNEIQLGIVSGTIGVAGLVGSILVSSKKKHTNKRVRLILNIMSFSFIVCNTLLGVGRNYYIWTFAVFAGNCMVPFLMANVEYIMRTQIPIEMQGRVFAARNTLQYLSMPLGYFLGGVLADKVFEPFMKTRSELQNVFKLLVGTGKGSGIALIYVALGILGFLGCCVFRFDRNMRKLDEVAGEL